MAFFDDLRARANAFRFFDAIGRDRWRMSNRAGMRDTLDVLVPVDASDPDGVGTVTTYATDVERTNVPCRVQPITGNEIEVAAEIIAASTFTVVCDPDVVIRSVERLLVTVDGVTRAFAIIHVNDLESRAWERKCYCTDKLSDVRSRT